MHSWMKVTIQMVILLASFGIFAQADIGRLSRMAGATAVARQSRMSVDGTTLVSMATRYFAAEGLPLPLTQAEQRLLLAAPGPERALAGPEPDPKRPNDDILKDPDYDASKADKWSDHDRRIIHEQLIQWLLTDPDARRLIHPSGVGVAGAIIGGLDLSFTEVSVPLWLRNCLLIGGVDFQYAKLAGLNLENSVIEPGLKLTNTQIDSDLVLDNATILRNSDSKYTLNGVELSVKNDVLMRNDFMTDGVVNLSGAQIGGSLVITDAEFQDDEDAVKRNKEDDELNGVEGADMTVGKQFQLDDVSSSNNTELILEDAKVGVLVDDVRSWPKQHSLSGFVYDSVVQLSPSADAGMKSRLNWLKSQSPFSTQPYQQLADLLDRLGEQDAATEVLIAKEDEMRTNGGLGWEGHVGKYILGPIIGYGYKPFRAAWPIMGFVILGTFLFSWGYSSRVLHRWIRIHSTPS